MESDASSILFPEESRRIIGAAMAVHNEIGHGFREKTYENALAVAFQHEGIPFGQQPHFPVLFRGVKVDDFIPDMVAYGKIIVDAKVMEKIGNNEVGQMLNYLRVTGYKLAIIINFKNPKLEFRRVAL